jgi:putative endonuclease
MQPDQRPVCLLRSDTRPSRYSVGLTSDVEERLSAHNAGKSRHTASGRPWRLVVTVAFADATRAAQFEGYPKSGSGRAFARRHLKSLEPAGGVGASLQGVQLSSPGLRQNHPSTLMALTHSRPLSQTRGEVGEVCLQGSQCAPSWFSTPHAMIQHDRKSATRAPLRIRHPIPMTDPLCCVVESWPNCVAGPETCQGNHAGFLPSSGDQAPTARRKRDLRDTESGRRYWSPEVSAARGAVRRSPGRENDGHSLSLYGSAATRWCAARHHNAERLALESGRSQMKLVGARHARHEASGCGLSGDALAGT